MNDKHVKKMIAPIVITIIVMAYYLFFFIVIFASGMPMIAKILLGVLPALFIGVLIYVLVERIKEIRSGEEDDLSKY